MDSVFLPIGFGVLSVSAQHDFDRELYRPAVWGTSSHARIPCHKVMPSVSIRSVGVRRFRLVFFYLAFCFHVDRIIKNMLKWETLSVK